MQNLQMNTGIKIALMFFVILLSCGSFLPGSQSSIDQKKRAVLRVQTTLIQASVVVTDKDGRPVRGLKKEDFVLLNEGKEQEISFFSEETMPTMEKTESASLPQNVFSNEPQYKGGIPSSLTIILFDTLNTRFWDQVSAKGELIKFLGQIQPQDRVAILSLGSDIRILHDFSSDTASLVDAVQRYRGRLNSVVGTTTEAAGTGNAVLDAIFDQANQAMNKYLDLEWRVENTLNAMTTIAEYVRTSPKRKNLIWVTGSFPFNYGFDSIPKGAGFSEDFGNYNDAFTKACRAISNANVAIYPVDARGLVGLADIVPEFNAATRGVRPQQNSVANSISSGLSAFRFTIDTMNILAAKTGGKAFYNSNDIMNSIRNAVDDGNANYTLGFYPRENQWNRAFHDLKVKVNRPGVEARHRSGFFALPGPKISPEDRSVRAAEAGHAALEATGITLRFRMEAAPGQGGHLKFDVAFDPRQITLELRDGRFEGSLHIAYLQRTSAGKVLASKQEVVKLRLSEDTYQKGLADGLSLSREWIIEPAAHELRIVVCDGISDSIGSIFIPIVRENK